MILLAILANVLKVIIFEGIFFCCCFSSEMHRVCVCVCVCITRYFMSKCDVIQCSRKRTLSTYAFGDWVGSQINGFLTRWYCQRMSNMRGTGTRGLVPVFWTGCSNNLWPRGALVGESRMNGSQRGFILRIHFSHNVIFCQVIWKLLSKGGAKIINSAEYCIF